jgi:hypothetical protein
MSVRHLYPTPHAEPDDDGRLTERDVQQAVLPGRRLPDGSQRLLVHLASPGRDLEPAVVAGVEDPAVGVLVDGAFVGDHAGEVASPVRTVGAVRERTPGVAAQVEHTAAAGAEVPG